MVTTRSSDAGASTNGSTEDKTQERRHRVYEEMEEYVARVRQLEIQNRELRAQLLQQDGGAGGGRPSSSSSLSSGWGSARVSSPVSKEMHQLRQANKALEHKVKEARRENQELREQFNESFEDARSKFRSQGRIHGNQMAAKKAEESSGQIAYLKDAVARLGKTNKELEAECRRLKKDLRDGPDLREELLRAKEEQAALERNVEKLQDEKENLERELEHQEERQSLGVAEDGERPRVQELEAEVRELKERIEDLTVDLEGRIFAEGEHNRLKQDLEDLKASLRTATAKQMKEARAGGVEYDQVVAELEQARKQVRRQGERCKELEEELEAATKAQNAAEDRVRRLESSPSPRVAVLAATVKEMEEEVQRLREKNDEYVRELEALEAERDEERRSAVMDQEAERKQAGEGKKAMQREIDRLNEELGKEKKAMQQEVDWLNEELGKEKKALQREVDRLKEELEEAEAKAAEAQAEAAAAQAVALERAANAEDDVGGEEGAADEEEVQRLQEENITLQREIEMYRELAASQDQQFSLVYIQEVNTQADYVVVENRTNLDISLAGWSLGTLLSGGEVQYEFPEELMLSARAAVKVWWGTKNVQHKLQPTRGNLFWEESDRIDIFKAQDDQVILMDPEGCEMSRMRIISGKRRARAGPLAGSPTPETKRPRTSYSPPGGSDGGSASGGRFGVRALY